MVRDQRPITFKHESVSNVTALERGRQTLPSTSSMPWHPASPVVVMTQPTSRMTLDSGTPLGNST